MKPKRIKLPPTKAMIEADRRVARATSNWLEARTILVLTSGGTDHGGMSDHPCHVDTGVLLAFASLCRAVDKRDRAYWAHERREAKANTS